METGRVRDWRRTGERGAVTREPWEFQFSAQAGLNVINLDICCVSFKGPCSWWAAPWV